MELTEEMLKSIRQQATDASMTGTSFPQGADDVTTLALVAEIERQREEIAALRAEVESRQRMYETEGEMRRQSERLVEKLTWFNNALDAKPDAAPAPEPAPEIKVGDSVRIVTGWWAGRTGVVIPRHELSPEGRIIVELHASIPGVILDYAPSDLELAND